MRINFIIIPALAILTSVLGSQITSQGMSWYKIINLPKMTPPGSIIGLVWTIIFILTTVSILIYYNQNKSHKYFWLVIGLFVVNAFLNVAWSYLFFGWHWLFLSIFEAALLGLSVFVLIILIWPVSKLSAILLIPYAAWVSFATYLTFNIWHLNK
ncbi:MAG: TspO/MBR family protein [Candidatus Buchananbacteria bacterium]